MDAPRFLADEDLRYEIVTAARRLEPALPIITIVEAGRAGLSDPEVLEFALGEGRLVVTHDVNTMKAEADERVRRGSGMPGLLLVLQSRPTRVIAESLVLIWAATTAAEWQGRVMYLPV